MDSSISHSLTCPLTIFVLEFGKYDYAISMWFDSVSRFAALQEAPYRSRFSKLLQVPLNLLHAFNDLAQIFWFGIKGIYKYWYERTSMFVSL
jgi:hypothetical protein